MKKYLLVLLTVAFYHPTSAQSYKQAEILWDTWGIPHIYAKNNESLFYAYGYAQARNHADLLLRLYGQARGKAAEVLGEKYTTDDRWVLTNSIPERAKTWFDAQTPEFQTYLTAFAQGINDYAKENPSKISDELKPFLPITPIDPIAHSQRFIYFEYSVSARAAANTLADKNGSNTWAIAPSRSASGHAMLLMNPHLPWENYYVYMEAQLVAPGLDVYGVSRIGFPVLTMAFSDDMGFANTANNYDQTDFYELTVTPNGYRFDGKELPFETEQKTLKIKQADGSLKQETLTIKRSIHGAVVNEKNGRAVALRVAGLDRPGMLQQHWDMCRVKNLNEFQAVMRQQQIPMFHYSYADKDGHIFLLDNGIPPVRKATDYKAGTGVLRGDTSATLWTTYHSYDALPKYVDPPAGWLQNANEPSWTATFPFANKPALFPPYLLPPPQMSFRSQRSARMLMEDEKISFAELLYYKHSTRMELADRILDDLATAVKAAGNAAASEALAVLEAWDRQCNADSRGAVLFEAFVQKWVGGIAGYSKLNDPDSPIFARKWDPNDPIHTPDGIADPPAAVQALVEAAAQVKTQHGSLDVPWGQVYHFKIPGADVPANGGPGPLGVFRVMTFNGTGRNPESGVRPFHGDSHVCAIEFGKTARAVAVTNYGNASQPGSPHISDQLKLTVQQKFRPVWRTRKEVLKHLEEKKVF
jgi:acyl-homoserine-lactone acylase